MIKKLPKQGIRKISESEVKGLSIPCLLTRVYDYDPALTIPDGVSAAGYIGECFEYGIVTKDYEGEYQFAVLDVTTREGMGAPKHFHLPSRQNARTQGDMISFNLFHYTMYGMMVKRSVISKYNCTAHAMKIMGRERFDALPDRVLGDDD